MELRYKSYFDEDTHYTTSLKESKVSYYQYPIIAYSLKEYSTLIKKLLKYKNNFLYIKFEYDTPYKTGDQFRNTVYLSTDSLSLSQVYGITNSVKALKLIKLKDDPFYMEINPIKQYSGKTKVTSI